MRLVFTAMPGDAPAAASPTINLRCSGTKTPLSIAMVLDPVPDWPATCQLSSTVQSELGSNKKAGCGGAPFSPGGTCAPRMPEAELSTLETQPHLPLSRYPPSTFSVVPVGA